MAELLLELFSEEIPARMQLRAADDLRRLVVERLAAAQLAHGEARSFVTAHRLTLVVGDLPLAQQDVAEERRGPRVGAPDAAVQGFLKSAGIASLAECEERDTGKGIFYFAMIRRAGQKTASLLPDLLHAAILDLPWPKSMRFPAAPFRWVRPLSSAICLLDGRVLPLDLGAVPVGDTTRGHRFLAPAQFAVADYADYAEKLRAGYVILDPVARRQKIADDLALMAKGEGLRLKDDPGLLDEVTGLVEFPVVLAGRIEPEFMDLPPEVLTTSMRAHQKYFALTDAAGKLAPKFLVVANNLTADGGATIIAGNQRVLRARLSDAKFFWDQDRKVPLESRVAKLAERIFHAKLGSVLAKVERVERLVDAIAPHVEGADAALATRAARLAKADLSTGMVGEFPELQGIMGRYYALHDGEPAAIADAIAEHYSPLGPNDRCPTAPTSVVVALADKIDTLAGFFAIDEKPTGSKDPYALRRAALGIIRLIIENKLRLPLARIFAVAEFKAPVDELLAFFADRLKVHLREQGVRHDLVAAVFALGGEDDLVRLLARVAALDAFLKSEDGANLLTAYRRASNIVRIEEKKDGRSYADAPDPAQMREAAESALAERLREVERLSSAALRNEEFGVAMAALARLRRPVDEFFNHVTVNSEDAALRINRLRLLSQIRATLNQVADFAQIEG
jgi:glycyl-tRNA synthetase beta chain